MKIFGISHLVFATDKEKRNLIFSLLRKLGYKFLFKDEYKKNIIEKNKYLKFSTNKIHNIYYFSHNKFYSIEVIEYKKIFKNQQVIIPSFEKICYKRDLRFKSYYYNIYLGKYSVSGENRLFIFNLRKDILNSLGFKKLDNNNFILNSFFKKWQVKLSIHKKNLKIFENYLDSYGFNMISFFCRFDRKPKHFIFVNSKKIFLNIRKYNNIFFEFLEVSS